MFLSQAQNNKKREDFCPDIPRGFFFRRTQNIKVQRSKNKRMESVVEKERRKFVLKSDTTTGLFEL